MRNSNSHPRAPSPSFSGTSALLLLAVAFCAYLNESHETAFLFAAIAFLSLSLAAPQRAPEPAHVPARRSRLGR